MVIQRDCIVRFENKWVFDDIEYVLNEIKKTLQKIISAPSQLLINLFNRHRNFRISRSIIQEPLVLELCQAFYKTNPVYLSG